jgi:hypothetical protein
MLAAFATPLILLALGTIGWSSIGARPVPIASSPRVPCSVPSC